MLAALALLASAAAAVACPVCYDSSGEPVTIGQQLEAADRAVLAAPAAGASQLRVVGVVKGEGAVGDVLSEPVADVIEDDDVALDHGPIERAGDPLLLLRDGFVPRWTNLGTVGIRYAGWLQQIAAIPLSNSEECWHRRVALALGHLEDPDPMVAQIAWGEVARAPYSAMSAARSRLDGPTVTGWLYNPALPPRRAAYTLLLGFVGGPAAAALLEQRIDSSRRSHDTTNLAAVLTADLELRGPSRVNWVETAYLADRSRTMPEIEAALLALNVLGDASGTIRRERVIQAYLGFIQERPQMAGFVARQLADWGFWGARAQYTALLGSNAIKDPAAQLAVVDYLQRAADAAIQ
jgi:hypothetical protein